LPQHAFRGPVRPDIMEVSNNNQASQPQFHIQSDKIKIHLPKLTSLKQVEVEIKNSTLMLNAYPFYRLELLLPESHLNKEWKAQFLHVTRTLILQ
jgi:hypothetical protein